MRSGGRHWVPAAYECFPSLTRACTGAHIPGPESCSGALVFLMMILIFFCFAFTLSHGLFLPGVLTQVGATIAHCGICTCSGLVSDIYWGFAVHPVLFLLLHVYELMQVSHRTCEAQSATVVLQTPRMGARRNELNLQ